MALFSLIKKSETKTYQAAPELSRYTADTLAARELLNKHWTTVVHDSYASSWVHRLIWALERDLDKHLTS